MSSFYHCSATDKNASFHHRLCPKEKDSWCFYNRALANGDTPKSHSEMNVHFELDDEGLNLVKQVYDRLTTDDMMMKCMRGKTPNTNESLHSRIWKYCSNHKNATKPILDFVVATATAAYNTGYVASNINKLLGIPYSKHLNNHLKALDDIMDFSLKRKMRNKRLQQDLEYASGSF
ncbi:hypothetical protein Pcinc_011881 [Petrolisthes cinctipes]|uniref:Uncharacterized protein n=1 Tax=Petrolisthes cinctipes TaxID=88211 RepID=A0AAE1G5Y1_PETCI|nr:hypothetical protein Pcinc_011881 [Petrolisthes cinctipes]